MVLSAYWSCDPHPMSLTLDLHRKIFIRFVSGLEIRKPCHSSCWSISMAVPFHSASHSTCEISKRTSKIWVSRSVDPKISKRISSSKLLKSMTYSVAMGSQLFQWQVQLPLIWPTPKHFLGQRRVANWSTLGYVNMWVFGHRIFFAKKLLLDSWFKPHRDKR